MKKNKIIENLLAIEFPNNNLVSFSEFNKQARLHYYAKNLRSGIETNEFQSQYVCYNQKNGEMNKLCSNPFTKYKKNVSYSMFKINDLDKSLKDTHLTFFTTHTLASKFHPYKANHIDANILFAPSTIKNGFEVLNDTHRDIYHNWTISYNGKTKHLNIPHIMVKEPHETTVPHSHNLYYLPLNYAKYFNNDIELMKQKFYDYWQSTCLKNGIGIRTIENEDNLAFVEIDREKGDAIGYLLKYVSKTFCLDNKYNPSDYYVHLENLKEKYANNEITKEEMSEYLESLEDLKLFDKNIDVERLLKNEALNLIENKELSEIGKQFWILGWARKYGFRSMSMSRKANSLQRQEFETFTKNITFKKFAAKHSLEEKGVNFYSALFERTYVIRNYLEKDKLKKQSVFNKVESSNYILIHNKEITKTIPSFEKQQIIIKEACNVFRDPNLLYKGFKGMFCHFYKTLLENIEDLDFKFSSGLYEKKEITILINKKKTKVLSDTKHIEQNFDYFFTKQKGKSYVEDKLLYNLLAAALEDKIINCSGIYNFLGCDYCTISYLPNNVSQKDFSNYFYNLLHKTLKSISGISTIDLKVYEKTTKETGLYFDYVLNNVTYFKSNSCINVELFCEKQKYTLMWMPHSKVA